MLGNIETLIAAKHKILSAQCDETESYRKNICEFKQKYEQRSDNVNFGKINFILSGNATMCLLTAPAIAFRAGKYKHALDSVFDATLSIDNCDQPCAMELKLKKLSDGEVTVRFALHPFDRANAENISDIELTYAILPKEFLKNKQMQIDNENLKWIRCKKKIKIKKKNICKLDELNHFALI